MYIKPLMKLLTVNKRRKILIKTSLAEKYSVFKKRLSAGVLGLLFLNPTTKKVRVNLSMIKLFNIYTLLKSIENIK